METAESEEIESHSIPVSVFLHLIPGTASLLVHIAIVGFVVESGWPVSFSWNVVANLLAFYPILFGVLFYVAKKRGNAGFPLKNVVVYQETLAIGKCLLWALAILLMTAPLMILLEPLGEAFRPYFNWVPATDEAYEGAFPLYVIAITFAFNFFFTAMVTPVAEELYYRGYLLPRMPTEFGRAGPVVHSFLFALHHVHTPWLLVTRTIGLLPLIYVTRFTRSVIPAILAHQAVNAYTLIEWAAVSLR